MESKNRDLEEKELGEMLASLKKVQAPANFEQAVLKRIRTTDAAETGSSVFLPVLKLALPVCAVLLLGSFLYFSGIFSSNADELRADADVTVPEQAAPTPDIPEEPLPTQPFSPSDDLLANAEEKTPVANGQGSGSAVNMPRRRKQREEQNIGGGSVVRGVRNTNEITTTDAKPAPEEFDVREVETIQPGFDQNAEISTKEMLELMGLRASYSGSGWRVDYVDPLGGGKRSGFQEGDVIIAADDIKLTERIILKSNTTFKSMRLVRDGKEMVVAIKP